MTSRRSWRQLTQLPRAFDRSVELVGEKSRLSAGCLDRSDDRAAALGVASCHNNGRTLGGEPDRDRYPDVAGGPVIRATLSRRRSDIRLSPRSSL